MHCGTTIPAVEAIERSQTVDAPSLLSRQSRVGLVALLLSTAIGLCRLTNGPKVAKGGVQNRDCGARSKRGAVSTKLWTAVGTTTTLA